MSIFIPAILKDREFQRFSAFIYDKVGIKLPANKKTMVEARMQKRLKALEMNDFEATPTTSLAPPAKKTSWCT